MALLTIWFWPSSIQNCEIINFYCFKPLHLWHFSIAALEYWYNKATYFNKAFEIVGGYSDVQNFPYSQGQKLVGSENIIEVICTQILRVTGRVPLKNPHWWLQVPVSSNLISSCAKAYSLFYGYSSHMLHDLSFHTEMFPNSAVRPKAAQTRMWTGHSCAHGKWGSWKWMR